MRLTSPVIIAFVAPWLWAAVLLLQPMVWALPKEDTKAAKNAKSTKGTKAVIDSCTHRVADQIGWSNWGGKVTTLAPVFRVKTDKDLRQIIKYSKKDGACTVRVTGATHSEDGLVMQRGEKNVVLISLVDHKPANSNWVSRVINRTTGLVRLQAGMSWYDASALYRPQGLVLPERTSGRFFSVGGVIANPVHGGSTKGGFLHSYVKKMLVMTSNGIVSEIQGDELKYWRSSGGQLGIILAVEMQLKSEIALGQSLNTEQSNDNFISSFDNPSTPTPTEIGNLIGSVTAKVYQLIATKDHANFYYNMYTHDLASFYADFSGPPFTQALSTQYANSAQFYLNNFGLNASFTGGTKIELPNDVCDFFCDPPNVTPCVPIPSQTGPGLLCQNPLEVAAAISNYTIGSIQAQYQANSASLNDGYLVESATKYGLVSVFFPSRAFPQIFGTWLQVNLISLAAYLGQPIPGIGFNYVPNSPLEFRFINPQEEESALMNPIKPFAQWKEKFDSAYFPGSFDNFFPPIQGIPDGLISIDVLNIAGVNDDDVDKYFTYMEGALTNTPSNPLAPYGENVVPDCDLPNGIVPCVSLNNNNLPPFGNVDNPSKPCCNPRVPVNVHIAKGWGYDVDQETTPTTGELVAFQNIKMADAVFAGRDADIASFNAKIAEYLRVFGWGTVALAPSRWERW